MARLLRVLILCSVLGCALEGCGPDPEILEAEMQIYRARVEEVSTTTATLAWDTNLHGDSKVDFSLVAESDTNSPDEESISDQNYVPRFLDGGVTIDAAFDHVSNTRYEKEFTRNHRVVLRDLLPGRTYVATVMSNNYLGATAHEFGARLIFTTNAGEG